MSRSSKMLSRALVPLAGLAAVLVACASPKVGSPSTASASPTPRADAQPRTAPGPVGSEALTPTPVPAWAHAPEGEGYRCQAPKQPEPLPALPTKERSIEVDPRACEPASGTVALPLGSFSVEVEGPSEDGCEVVVTDEIEGGYTRRRCSLPRGKRRVRLEPGQTLGSCDELETGNAHHDLAAALNRAIQMIPVEGSSFTVGVREDVAGDGARLDSVDVAAFEYRLFEDKAFERPASCDRCSGRLVLDVSTDDALGEGVLGALKAPTRTASGPIAVGGKRSIVVREEAAAGLREHLPAIPPQAQICIQLELVEAEP